MKELINELETILDGMGYDLAELKLLEMKMNDKQKWAEEIINKLKNNNENI